MSAQLADAAVPGYFDLGYYEKLVELVSAWRRLGEIPADALPSAETYAAGCSTRRRGCSTMSASWSGLVFSRRTASIGCRPMSTGVIRA
jgi:hypothetical protein